MPDFLVFGLRPLVLDFGSLLEIEAKAKVPTLKA